MSYINISNTTAKKEVELLCIFKHSFCITHVQIDLFCFSNNLIRNSVSLRTLQSDSETKRSTNILSNQN